MASSTSFCESDFEVLGIQDGERVSVPVQVLATLITATLASSWTSGKIKRLSMFFAHWLSGLMLTLDYTIESVMVTLCWTSSNLEGFIKAINFFALTAANMLAITNLAICVNLTLIVLSHRTMARVRSVSSPRLMLVFLAISMVTAAASIPFWDTIQITGAAFWITSSDEAGRDFVYASRFYVEFFVGVCMLFIVAWLLLFRTKEIKECWKLHLRIRFYFGLTVIGVVTNLSLGICGTINLVVDSSNTALLISWSWIFRYIHIVLDTFVLYGVVLREKKMDGRAGGARSASDILTSGQPTSGHATSGGPQYAMKPVKAAPKV